VEHAYTHIYTHAQKKLEDVEDAENELMLCDDETVRYVAGECFVYMDKEAAEERLQKLSSSVNADLSAHKAKVEETQVKMKELKAALYGKFGNSINL
jgi:prefoldin subunit 4